MKPKTTACSDEHLDIALGDVHECALAMQMAGQAVWSIKLAKAHEQFTALYLLASDLYERLDHHRIPLGHQMEQEIKKLLTGGI